MINQEYIRYLFDYNGQGLTWRKPLSNRVVVGSIVGDKKHVVIKQVKYRISHIVWLWHYGEPVPKLIDHRDGNRQNNSIDNLREATQSQNMANTRIRIDNTSGHKGISWAARNKKWRVQVNRQIIGFYSTLEEAIAARRTAAERIHGEFVRHA